MSAEEQSNRPRGGHIKKEIEMQTQLNQNSTAPMVRCAGDTRRKSIDELLAEVRITDPVWFARFEDANLSVAASADVNDIIALLSDCPGGSNGRLAGFVEGLWVNS